MDVPLENKLKNQSINIVDSFLKSMQQHDTDFLDVFNGSKIQSNEQFIHVEGLRFKLESEVVKDQFKAQVTETNISDNMLGEGVVHTSESDKSDPLQPLPVFLNVTANPANVFLAQLPKHLTSFINRFVEIIKQYDYKSALPPEIRARFPSLNLDVIFSTVRHDESLKIKVFVGADHLKDVFKDNEEQLKVYLKKKLDLVVDLDMIYDHFDDVDYQQDSGESEGGASEQDQNEDDIESKDEFLK